MIEWRYPRPGRFELRSRPWRRLLDGAIATWSAVALVVGLVAAVVAIAVLVVTRRSS